MNAPEMDRATLLQILRHDFGGDVETSHCAHDAALVAYLNDPEITEAFVLHEKRYA
jgi:hypothetical protein